MEFLMKRILAIGSHFDDIEMGCSGTILKHIQNGDEVFFAITHTDEYRTGPIADRLKEQDKSLELFGLPNIPRYLFLFAETDTDAEIIEVLDKIKPDIVFAPFEHDTHQHHRRSSVIAQAVSRKRHITTLFYDSGSTYDFHPNIFSMIDFKQKFEILKCFKSQIDCGAISLDIVKKKDSYWASLVTDEQDKYAEGFVIRKMIWKI
jgi:LmbE family N-acetylglucosaminyl deacetylase